MPAPLTTTLLAFAAILAAISAGFVVVLVFASGAVALELLLAIMAS